MPATPLHLEIAQTWDGRPVDSAEVTRLILSVSDGMLRIEVDAPFHGDPPPEAPPGPTDGLWEYEVVELFVCGAGSAYTEIELGPHGHHLVLQLEAIRSPSATLLPIDYEASLDQARWQGVALVPLSLLPPGPHRINATAIHGAGSGRSYLSLGVLPGELPDFHQPSHFPVQADLT